MIEPLLRNDALLQDIARSNISTDSFRLWWLGQSGFLLQWRGRHLLLDPYLSDSLTEKYAGTDLPHVRMTSCPISPRRLNFIDLITASHVHTDHLDGETIRAVLEASPNARLVVPGSARNLVLERLQGWSDRVDTIEAGLSIEIAGFRITGIPSAHETLETDDLGRNRFLGYIVQMGPWTLYHSGDTVLYEGIAERLKPFRIDVAVLPINGRCGRVAGNLSARDSVWLANAIEARLVIPCHYDMFAFNTGRVTDFIAVAQQIGQRCSVLRCGEQWNSESLQT
jgi:L-ascorbate metabolism protein UlaG (beta-lactamase superfamily)